MAVDIFKIGSVELLVLLLLREQDAHGYQLAQLMEENSDGLLTVKTASLYPMQSLKTQSLWYHPS